MIRISSRRSSAVEKCSRIGLCVILAAGLLRGQAHVAALPEKEIDRRLELGGFGPVPNLAISVPPLHRLRNGATLFRVPAEPFPLVSLAIAFRDARFPTVAGNGSLTAAIGTALIREQVRSIQTSTGKLGVKVDVNASVTSRHIIIRVSGLDANFAAWGKIVISGFCDADLPASSIERAISETKNSSQRDPDSLATDFLVNALYGVPLTNDKSDWPDAEAVHRWYKSRISPRNMLIGSSGGDIRVLLDAAKACTGIPYANSPAGVSITQKHGNMWIIDKPGSLQTRFVMAALTVGQDSPQWPAILLMNQILDSRLYSRIRSARGLSYDVSSRIAYHAKGNPLIIGAGVQLENSRKFTEALQQELSEMASTPVPARELEKAKQALLAGFALSYDGVSNRLNLLLTSVLAGVSTNYWSELSAKVRRIAPIDLLNVSRTHLSANSFIGVAVGNARTLETLLADCGYTTTIVPNFHLAKPE